MSLFTWIIFGLIAGWIGGRLYGEGRPEGCLTNIVVGIGGALLGGAIYALISGHDFITRFDLPSLVVAALGSVILIAILRRLSGDRR